MEGLFTNQDYLDNYFSVSQTLESNNSRGEAVELRVTTPESRNGNGIGNDTHT